MKLMKRIAAMLFLLFLLLYPKMMPSATTELRDNQLDMKTDRIETKKGEKEIQGGNQEDLFDETLMNEISERIAQEEKEREEQAKQIFIKEMKDVALYDNSDLFSEADSSTQAVQTNQTTKDTEATVDRTNVFLFIGIAAVAVVAGAIASVLNYKKGV